jgi:hypothetical protein
MQRRSFLRTIGQLRLGLPFEPERLDRCSAYTIEVVRGKPVFAHFFLENNFFVKKQRAAETVIFPCTSGVKDRHENGRWPNFF